MKTKTTFFAAFSILMSGLAFSQTQIGNTIEGSVFQETFGRQVILNADATQVMIAAATYKDPVLGANTGRVQVYTLNGNQWQQKGTDMKGLTTVSGFGIEADMTPDGVYVAVGAPFYPNNTAEPRRGEVRIFKYLNNDWTQVGQQILGVRAGDRLGGTVSISENGKRFSTGATQYDAPGLSQSGLARVFEFNETTQLWSQIGQDLFGAASDFYGIETELSKDGTRLAVGAQGKAGTSPGYTIIYDFNTTTNLWEQVGATIFGDTIDDQLGFYIEFNAAANKVAVSSYKSDNSRGMVKVFELVGNNWQQIGNTILGKQQTEQFGLSLSISDDGNSLIVGAPYNDENGSDTGSARLYKLINNFWVQQGDDFKSVDQSNQAHAGSSVFINGAGEKIAIGYEQEKNSVPLVTGVVRVYDVRTLLGIKSSELSKEKLVIYPNPTNDQFKIQSSNSFKLENVEIYSADGKLVKKIKANQDHYSVRDFPKGTYIIVANTTNHKKMVQTLIKN